MKRTLARAIPGIALICLGTILLLANLRLLGRGFTLVWPLFFACLGITFLAVFFADRAHWWAAIPGCTLLGLAAVIGIGAAGRPFAEKWGAAAFLFAVGLAFCLVYLARRQEWWAVIPGGTLFTLAAAAGLEGIWPEKGIAALFFLGLGSTFLLIRLLPGGKERRWALYPAFFLISLGLFFVSAAFRFFGYLWPAVLIAAGLLLILKGKKP